MKNLFSKELRLLPGKNSKEYSFLPSRDLLKDINIKAGKEACNIIEASEPSKAEKIILRTLVILGLCSLVVFIYHFFRKEHIGYVPLFSLLCLSVGYKLLKVLFEWYHYWVIKKPEGKVSKREWIVDMFTTAMPGEPYHLIKDTLEAMIAVRYPHATYLCDEGDDPQLKALCEQLGVIHVTRTEKINAKAGNINNALKVAKGEICVILDPDHKPHPHFLSEVLPYFEDSEVGYVQIVQSYKNAGESFVARGAAEQTYMFYGPLMMGMNSYGTVQAIGANCTFRRSALDSIGGHAAGLSEDMHTAMQLHAKGWKSVYLPKVLAKGLVPSNLSAYYKQQLKWSRGTFDLLFNVFPQLFTRFTWRQRLHYLLVPLHFAAGIVALIDMIIPIAALITGYTPVLIDFSQIYLYLVPLFCFIIITRQYAQKWLLEKHEHGFHLSGGVLLFGTWWIMLFGFIFTVFRIKVPYIPTPKDGIYENNIKLNLPNLAVCILSVAAILYGLHRDSGPYTFLMAGFALFNVFLLSTVFIASQDATRMTIKARLRKTRFLTKAHRCFKQLYLPLTSETYRMLRQGAPLFSVFIVCFFLIGVSMKKKQIQLPEVKDKYAGGFYTGLYLPQAKDHNTLELLKLFRRSFGTGLNIVALDEHWKQQNLQHFPRQLMDAIARSGAIPMISWEPWKNDQGYGNQDIRPGENIIAAIAAGKYDDYITAFALKVRDYKKPVFISFCPESGNPVNSLSVSGENTPKDFIAAWQRIVNHFSSLGAINVAWVWNPWDHKQMDQYYPGDYYVDWISINLLSYTKARQSKVQSFESTYKPYQKKLLSYNKPVMLCKFHAPANVGDEFQWMKEAFSAIRVQFKEIKSLVFCGDAGTRSPESAIDIKRANYEDRSSVDAGDIARWYNSISSDFVKLPDYKNNESLLATSARSKLVTGGPGSYRMIVDGKPFYIKGIAYNLEHDWRDGYHPLDRRKLESDFSAIKRMGCNTIRRYKPSIYDRNILSIAGEQGLKVIYGVWFDPEVDYYKDSARVKDYIRQVEEKVRAYKSSKAIIAWNIGNEASGLLKHHFNQPYLTIVRRSYMDMIERMTQLIHKIDPSRPVFTSLEHAQQLPGELYGFHTYAPSIDIIGINSYYEQQISKVDSLTHAFDSTRPYMISEFGAKGYWNHDFSDFDFNKIIIEESDKVKALLYIKEWNEYIEKHKGANIGGIAFCWQDRYEGTATWFGITDYKGRRKPVYYALQKVWSDKNTDLQIPNLFIIGPNYKVKPGGTYTFTAVCTDTSIKKFEWHLLKEDYLEKSGEIKQTAVRNKIELTLPKKGSRFRLYVYACNSNNTVITASKSIYLYNDIYNEGL